MAFDLGFALGGRYFVPKVAYNEAFKTVGPGHLIVGEILRDLQNHRMTELDMLGHTDPYKARWTDAYRQHYHCQFLDGDRRDVPSKPGRITSCPRAGECIASYADSMEAPACAELERDRADW